jgi:membrane peptidoglycan carboxypeptidase
MRILAAVAVVLALALLGLVGWAVIEELRSSLLLATVVSRYVARMTFSVGAGPNERLPFPQGGPYDQRLGYTQIPAFVGALREHDMAVSRQARVSPTLDDFVARGGFAVYGEKNRAGLALLDRNGLALYQANYPRATYDDWSQVPPLVAATLMFIEDKGLLDARYPLRNPAIDWPRLLVAAAGQVAGKFDPSFKGGGASTLATQIEKFRHSPEGRTNDAREKLRQMASATARAYRDGPDTWAARKRILMTYLNSTPLGSRPGYGEIIGVADGLKAWFGTDFAEVNQALRAPAADATALTGKAILYRQVLALLLAERRPTFYLQENHGALAVLEDRYLHRLCDAGVITADLRDAALAVALPFSAEAPAPPKAAFRDNKAADAVRTELMSWLHVPGLYALDRLDAAARTTIDEPLQSAVTEILARLSDRAFVGDMGLVGHDLLGSADPAGVTYSVVLYQREAGRNVVRVHADSLDAPFDINSDAKLILGSTAKLRTLVTYLDVIETLHARLASLPTAELVRRTAAAEDPLTRWAADYLASSADRSLPKMLDAAMARHYSGSPAEVFFTGGGAHIFHNFERSEDGQVPTVEDAFRHSVNLAFVRIMRDICRYYLAQEADVPATPERHRAYLSRFADEEGTSFLNHFYDLYRGRSPDGALALAASHARPLPRRQAVVYRSVRPTGGPADFAAFMRRVLPGLDQDDLDDLYDAAAPDRFSLNDRAYLAGMHPLELWLAAYLQDHPGAGRAEVLKAGADVRQEAYAWLFKTRNAHKQDVRIRILKEEDAFESILQDWRRQGYPFGRLVPSYASAIGSSGDRPHALARLMGIILNDGLAQPTVDVDGVDFAADTPYETDLVSKAEAPRRVLSSEVATVVRRALTGVVSEGTGTRIRAVFQGADGLPLVVGGKTGTGDNRFDSFTAGGRLSGSRVVDRTATFVFFVGDHLFGSITAFVRGDDAKSYHFTSALAVQLLKVLAPTIRPLVESSLADAGAASAPIGTPAAGPPTVQVDSLRPR